jgi:hypothetical protein
LVDAGLADTAGESVASGAEGAPTVSAGMLALAESPQAAPSALAASSINDGQGCRWVLRMTPSP